jgi:hypothetical protein
MPLDHYIPQVHLKNFYSPVLGNQMYATVPRALIRDGKVVAERKTNTFSETFERFHTSHGELNKWVLRIASS